MGKIQRIVNQEIKETFKSISLILTNLIKKNLYIPVLLEITVHKTLSMILVIFQLVELKKQNYMKNHIFQMRIGVFR